MTASRPEHLAVALVHERFTEVGGSEKVVEQLHQIWPSASVYAPLVDRSVLPGALGAADVAASMPASLYRGGPRYARLLPLLPLAMRRIDLTGVDLVVLSHHAFASRVRPPAGVPVLAYVHTPGRWMWEPHHRRAESGRWVGTAALSTFAASQRRADRASAQRLSLVVANSRHVAARIERYWGRSAQVVPPPVDTDFYCPAAGTQREDFFLLAGRLVPYKRPELAAAAARRAGVRLVVAGDGRSRQAVADAGGSAVEMRGAVDDATLRDLFRRCSALVFPGEEDFGMVPVEAMACGAPVIALAAGGVLDSVIQGRTGVLYEGAGAAPLAGAMARFEGEAFDADVIAAHARTFGADRFRREMAEIARRLVDDARQGLLRGRADRRGRGPSGPAPEAP